jgi:NADH-quinone oxidoreductase subunit J
MQLVIQIVFGILAVVIIGSALMVVAARNVIHAALWLISSFFGVGALYLLLQAEFIAIVQVLVYVGAVSILLLFAIMLTRHVTGGEDQQLFQRWWLALLGAGLLFVGILFPALTQHSWASDASTPEIISEEMATEPPPVAEEDAADIIDPAAPENSEASNAAAAEQPEEEIVTAADLGTAFMQEFLLPFEVASVVLLVALIGAIVIAFEERVKRRKVLTLAEEVAIRKKQQQQSGRDT